MKECDYCCEDIKENAKVCPYCKRTQRKALLPVLIVITLFIFILFFSFVIAILVNAR